MNHTISANGAELVAAVDLEAGEELTFPYSHSPSRARLLTSFGFDGDKSLCFDCYIDKLNKNEMY